MVVLTNFDRLKVDFSVLVNLGTKVSTNIHMIENNMTDRFDVYNGNKISYLIKFHGVMNVHMGNFVMTGK